MVAAVTLTSLGQLMASDYKTAINGEIVYHSQIRETWEPVLLCDACHEEATRDELVSLGVDILDCKTFERRVTADIHERCLPTLCNLIRESRKDMS